MKNSSLIKVLVCIMLLASVLLVSSCGGNITPTPDGGNGNVGTDEGGDNTTPKTKLETPVISYSDGSTIYWGAVEGAIQYMVEINSTSVTDTVTTDKTFIDLEKYYSTSKVLQVFITAIAPEDGDFANSSALQHIFEIPDGSMAEYAGFGLGNSVNLLTGSYIKYSDATGAGNSVSIFDKVLFNRLDAVKNPITGEDQHDTEVIYSTSIESYTKKISEKNSSKLNLNASVDAFGIAKVTAGYNFNVDSEYSKKTFNETQAIFYDMNYTYKGYQLNIADFSDPEALSYALSEEFINDVVNLENGTISPKQFVDKYGTHVITSGIYGASFIAHYESLMSKEDAETTFGENVLHSINLALMANIKGVKIEVDGEYENAASISTFVTSTNSNTQSKFSVKATGGDHPVNMVMTNLSDFSAVCENWANGIEGSSRLNMIDVPNGSLFFVWDFLGDDHAEAKNILNQYFYSVCDDQYKTLNGKVNSIYQDFVTFDQETGTLTIDWVGRQHFAAENIKLDGTVYYDGEALMFDYDNGGVFTVYSKYNGHDVNKVVFKGAYNTKDSHDQLISNMFEGVSIVFDKHWERDIVVEFENFAFIASEGKTALDLSNVESANIFIILNGSNYIYGGNGNENNGYVAVYAPEKVVTFEGEGSLEIHGGNAKAASNAGANGNDGGVGVFANELIMNMTGTLTIIGGEGSDGIGGNDGGAGSSYTGHVGSSCGDRNPTGDGANGGNGGNGNDGGDAGKGAYAYIVNNIVINNGSFVAIGGKSGNGGAGGAGGAGGRGQDSGGWNDTAGNGGTGGNGGNGGDTFIIAASNGSETITANAGTYELINGTAGNVGAAGAAGAGGGKGYHCEHVSSCDQFGTWGNNGSAGSSGSAGSEGEVIICP